MISKKGAAQLLAELDESDETEHLEVKAISGSNLGKSVFETICAFSNEPGLEGGTILLGVEKEMALFPLYKAVGVADVEKICSDVSSGCADMFNNPIRVDISIERVGKASIIRIDVPELQPHQKPAYFKSVGLPRGAFRRIGPNDHRCTEADLLSFFQDKDNAAYDTTVVHEATWDDIDPTAIEAYRTARAKLNELAEELAWSDEDLVYALGGARRLDGQLHITVAGLLTFGKPSALRRIFPSHRVDYIRVPGTAWVGNLEEPYQATEMRGPTLSLVGRVITAVLDDLPKAYRIDEAGDGQRTDLPTLPFRVIREAVVNAIIHRSYQTFQPVQIIRYANRIEIKNPGYSLKSEDRFDDPTSVMRNPKIAEVMHETNFAETKGSGIRLMRQNMKANGLSSPSFNSDRESDSFTAIFLFHHFLNPEDLEWLSQFKSFELTDDQRRALIFVREVGAIDNSTYRSFTQAETLVASRNLRKLRAAELLSDKGSSSRTYYVAGPEMLKRMPLAATLAPNSQEKRANSQESRENSQGSPETAIVIEDLPAKLRTPVRNAWVGRRLSLEAAFDLVEALCEWRDLSAAEIAALLSKNATYVTQTYISPLIREGRLVYTFPEMVNHPGQKYRAAKRRPRGKSGTLGDRRKS